jgi:hypothetical protein
MMKRTAENGSKALLLPVPAGAESEPSQELKSWALVELFGHQRIVGFLSQQTFGTGVLFRVDVPDLIKDEKIVRVGFTRYFGLSSIYSITPISEEIVRRLLPTIDGTPGEARALSTRSYRQDDEDQY